MNNIGEYLGYIILIIFSFGWIDTLWIFGIENSKNTLGGINSPSIKYVEFDLVITSLKSRN